MKSSGWLGRWSRRYFVLRGAVEVRIDSMTQERLSIGASFGKLSLLGEMGCKYAQGYYFARPLPMDKLREFLQS